MQGWQRITFIAGILWGMTSFGEPPAVSIHSAIFDYAARLPIHELKAFDAVIVHPYGTAINPLKYDNEHSQLYAYVSLGELDQGVPYQKEIPNNWLKAKNNIWQSKVFDITNQSYQQFFLDKIIAPLYQKGYRGFFFDTMDSYLLFAATPSEIKKQQEAQIHLIEKIKEKYPDIKIILNRGFEILPAVKNLIKAVAVESLYQSWDQKRNAYMPVSQADKNYIQQKMDFVKSLNLTPIVIDYAAEKDNKLAELLAKKIMQNGYVPYIGNGQLNNVGISSVKVIPRKIYAIYDRRDDPSETFTGITRFLSTPLSHMGYYPELHTLSEPLPTRVLTGEYAGILVWFKSDLGKNKQNINQWLQNQIHHGMKVVVLGELHLIEDPKAAQSYGLSVQSTDPLKRPITFTKKTDYFGYENPPISSLDEILPIHAKKQKIILQVKDVKGEFSDVAAITDWGGYISRPYIVNEMPDGQSRWVVDPFRFLKDAFALPEIPVPDTTTESGRRMMMVHIDGDGFASKAEWPDGPYAGKVFDDEIVSKYRVPMTVSLIEGEIAKTGLYPEHSTEFESIARDIFSKPWVEPASHTFSHPFEWRELEEKKSGLNLNLPIKNYQFDIAREIKGSCDYIDTLSPKDKKCDLIFWSGDTDPSAMSLAYTYRQGFLNLNGGETIITNSNKSLTNIAPLGVFKGRRLQIYAPNQNENVYTNNWRGPFYGYRRVIETFELTENPVRYKPIDVYFHIYSVSKKASLKAVNTVLDWAIQQKTIKNVASHYIKVVQGFYNANVTQMLDDGWQIRNNGQLREFRIKKSGGYLDFKRSQNVAGYNDHNDDRYLHLGPASETKIYLKSSPDDEPYLIEANAEITTLKRSTKKMVLGFHGFEPIQFSIGQYKNCVVKQNENTIMPREVHDDIADFELKDRVVDAITIQC